mmetsp:Transcript_8677/g.35736  ORF Transcript_8677/g.35736 Transcript_8677/m.35736 type:complete len:160 (+) Transcript_8677:172-651(+)
MAVRVQTAFRHKSRRHTVGATGERASLSLLEPEDETPRSSIEEHHLAERQTFSGRQHSERASEEAEEAEDHLLAVRTTAAPTTRGTPPRFVETTDLAVPAHVLRTRDAPSKPPPPSSVGVPPPPTASSSSSSTARRKTASPFARRLPRGVRFGGAGGTL